MSFIQTSIIVFFLLLACLIGIGLFRSIMNSSKQGVKFRENLLARVQSVRMHKMLQALGINHQQYAYSHRVSDIEKHIDRCTHCANTEQCDSELASGAIKHAESYCPNNSDLLATPLKNTTA